MKTMTKSLLSLALACAPMTAQAQALDFNSEEMCLLNPDTGEGIVKISLSSIFVQLLTAVAPDRYGLVEGDEVCEDGKDNDCNGFIDDGCSVPTPTVWGPNAECDACMEDKCGSKIAACEGDQACQDAVACVVENSCLDRFLGPLGCVCGEGVSVPQCQGATSMADLQGACVEGLITENSPLLNDNPLPAIAGRQQGTIASEALICQGRFCQDECAGNYWNYDS